MADSDGNTEITTNEKKPRYTASHSYLLHQPYTILDEMFISVMFLLRSHYAMFATVSRCLPLLACLFLSIKYTCIQYFFIHLTFKSYFYSS